THPLIGGVLEAGGFAMLSSRACALCQQGSQIHRRRPAGSPGADFRRARLLHRALAISLLHLLLVNVTWAVWSEGEKTDGIPFDVSEMDTLQCVAFSPDGKMLAVGGSPGSGMLAVYDFPSGRRRFLVREHRMPVWAVAFSPDGTRLAAGG